MSSYAYGVIAIAICLGCIPGAIAQKKGYPFVQWWVFGALLFIVALPVSIAMKPAVVVQAAGRGPTVGVDPIVIRLGWVAVALGVAVLGYAGWVVAVE